ncbi:MAG: hypothetical protein OEV93_03785 [Candidatus Moranbacteria bacterium]|nr:hypothetical protein [Candidatus Moranbacteria bacterium]
MDKKIVIEKLKDDFRVRIFLLLVLGFLLGFIIKLESVESMVIGFDDYRVDAYVQGYDFNEIKDEMNAKIDKMKAEAEMQGAMEE